MDVGKVAAFYAARLIELAQTNPPLADAMRKVDETFHVYTGDAGSSQATKLALLDAFRKHQPNYPLTRAITDKLASFSR